MTIPFILYQLFLIDLIFEQKKNDKLILFNKKGKSDKIKLLSKKKEKKQRKQYSNREARFFTVKI